VNAPQVKSDAKPLGISVDYFALVEKEGARQKSFSPAIADAQVQVSFANFKESKSKKVLQAPVPNLIAVYQKLPEKSEMEIEYGMFPESVGSVKFSAAIVPEKGTKEELFSDILSRGYFFQPRKVRRISLSRYTNKIVRIQLSCVPVSDKKAPSKVYFGKWIIRSPKSPPAVSQSFTSNKQRVRPHIFIYLIDALRGDYLQPYGYKKATSPRIQEFAADSVVFDNAFAQTAWTRASVATIMTGLYPSSHLTENRMDVLPEFIPTLAGELKANGYSTYGFCTNGNISRAFGFDRHYDAYQQLREDIRSEKIHVQSDELFQHVRSFFDQELSHPSFVYIHATDPHEPYTPAPFSLNIPSGCAVHDRRLVRPRMGHKHSKEERECIRTLYESEIVKADHYFGKFIDLLKQKNLFDNSFILLTADHGEEFWEHGLIQHGASLYQAEIKVPLIVHFPNSQFSRKRIQECARHIDIFPTILDLLSLKIPPGVQGSSLLRLIHGEKFEGPVFGELRLDIHRGRYLILYPYKLLEIGKDERARQFLFDMDQDPREKTDLSQSNPVRFEYMRSLLNEWTNAQEKRKALLKKPKGAVLDPETAEALKALGYLH
jgi:arylsulfatase A-like enzyme